jgi:hypothetical protein
VSELRKLVLALVLALAATPAARATTEPTPAVLLGCVYDETARDEHQAGGVLLGGPVAVADLPPGDWDPAANPVQVTLTCSLQGTPDDHSAPDVVVASGSGTGVAFVPPTAYTVLSPDPYFACAQVDVTDANGNAATYYSHHETATWSTDPGSGCAGAPRCAALDCSWWYVLVEDSLDRLL